ncbi:uncharacterized protein Nmag_0172 [Natrialba magadii ATCC 43099]|uniref:Uncharacterized protein n=2 Tax=Natrialba magadii TaxID=13769 RepID=D3SWH2_NATMM|nr:uncharacterized protein Nmag_0172 [Natrialba magadii ATCC 43099]ELY33819.1 hypothetical protein C500_01298 [Natrialba magadii ATCC 43099]
MAISTGAMASEDEEASVNITETTVEESLTEVSEESVVEETVETSSDGEPGFEVSTTPTESDESPFGSWLPF